MLGVKILINLQVGSVRIKRFALPFDFSKAVASQDLPGNHRGGRSFISAFLRRYGRWLKDLFGPN